jgi:hypothetical protein
VKVFAGLFNGTETSGLDIGSNRYAYVHVARGNLDINGTRFDESDSVRIGEERELRFTEGNSAEVLVFSLRPNELPN